YFKRFITVVLRKLGKDNYIVLKVYRPIALLNTVGKIIDIIIIKRLSYFTKIYGLLLNSYIGRRRR
ncbi:zinc knuckle, partial [Colletotrichum tamarilloi]